MGYYIPMILMIEQAENLVSNAVISKLVMIWGFSNLLGRFLSGRLGDYGHSIALCTSFWIFIIGHGMSGVALMIFPHVMHFGDVAFIVFVIVYGFFIAPLATMRSVIVSDMYGSHNARASFGWFLFAQGIVQIIGFVLPTFLNDFSPVYPYSFGAVSFILSSLFVLFTYKPFFKAREKAIAKDKAKEEAKLRRMRTKSQNVS